MAKRPDLLEYRVWTVEEKELLREIQSETDITPMEKNDGYVEND